MIVFYDHQVFELQRHGGISRYFHHLFAEFARTGEVQPEIFFGVHVSELETAFAALGRRRGLAWRLPVIPRTNRLRRAANRGMCRSLLGRSAAPVYHPTYQWTPARRPRQRVAFTVHDLIRERFPALYEKDDPEIKWRAHSLAQADVVFTNSEFTRSDLLNFYPVDPGKIIVTPLANTLRGVEPKPTGRRKPFLLFVGQRDGYKNFAIVLEAFRQNPALGRDFDLVCFAGEPALPAAPTSLRIDHVRGPDPVLAGLYRDAFALVYPSRLEGFGLPLLEAMSLGCPVIASRHGSLPEVGGQAALYFDSEDAADLAAKIESLQSPAVRAEHIRRGHQRELEFSWARTAELTASGYRRICA